MMTVNASYVAPFTSATVFPEQSPEELMAYETWRLKSFDEWPREAYDKARPMALAKDGFYYTGTEDIVKCFSCGVQKGQWAYRSKPNVEHQRLNPECQHLREQDARNIPIHLANPETYQRCLVYLKDILLSEITRLHTFKDIWPHCSPSPNDLAKAGFYFAGSPDRVQCVFCNGILKNWQDVDIPMIEHRKHFPNCPFVSGHQVGNIPIDVRSHFSTSYNERLDATLSYGTGATNQFTPVSGIHTERPRHLSYATEASRIASYTTWPSGLSQTPQQLAKAGFFYAGFDDSVKCFFCDGGLRTWERGDDPWEEHAKWFSRCPYLLQVRGEVFVQRFHHNNFLEGDHKAGGSSISVVICDRGNRSNEINLTLDQIPVINQNYAEERSDIRNSRNQRRLCVTCKKCPPQVQFLPCGHLICCMCAKNLPRCPSCKIFIRDKIYFVNLYEP